MTKQSIKEIGLQLAQPVLQEPLEPITISVKELVTERKRYTIPASYQRKKVWGIKDKQQFIDSLMLGDPFPPVQGYEGPVDEQGLTNLEIGDGQNRLSTIIEFVLGGFKTWTVTQKLAAEPNSKVGPVQPGKLFKDWDPIHKNYLLKLRVRIDRLRDRPEMEKAIRFIRVQTHVKLSAAEILNAFPSKAKTIAQDIEQHSFWGDFYEGKTHRGELFQSSLYLLALEMAPGGIVDLQSGGFIQSLISGDYDDKITDVLVESVLERLNVVSHVYSGLHFTRRIITVAMYQSVMRLEQSGYVIQAKDKGQLTKWLDPILNETRRSSGIPSYAKPIQALASAKGQVAFWDRHLSTIMNRFGVNQLVAV